ncbi:MAG: sigma 54-interacting transcriptional regulator [Firmicutes bacterium]|nr:sigma 54-interacting transcriptional regulator [Bacillota bacterium]MDY5857000.1 sigma 54-interacting transcriptional regulator [Anaerovoracaceae bacterium]
MDMKEFGMNRVLEPKGAVPTTAWKLDNQQETGPKEIRVRLEMVHLEWGNFNQICSYCGYDETRIKARIMQIINERGKLHNPYTGSGGLFLGTVEEIGSEVQDCGFSVGDPVISQSSISGLPMYIDSIRSVDFNYGQIECRGYAICFETTSLLLYSREVSAKYLLTAIDEEGNFLSVRQAVQERMAQRAVIIGGNLVTTLLYAQIIRECFGETASVTAVLDQHSMGDLTGKEIGSAFEPVIDQTCFVDLSRPMDAWEQIRQTEKETEPVDVVINLEDICGSETLATLLVREQGAVFYNGLQNNYSVGILVADAFSKEVTPHALDGFHRGAYELAMELIRSVSPNLKRLDAIYREKRKKRFNDRMGRQNGTPTAAVQRIDDFVYQSPVTRAMVEEALNVAQYDCNVIIQGETGVGKEKVFNIIYQNSPRHGKPCIRINCATIQENLAESEFFGYEKGSFTGAQSTGKEGYFEIANNGTLFLDEIGSLSLNMQSKLLRVLQDNTYYRVGGTEQRHANVRVICANNVPLRQLVEEGKFREDLYYRLNICSIDVPALRDRKEDILCLAEAFLKNYNKKYGVNKELSPEALEKLEAYHWPGNVRELENVVHRLYIRERERIIGGDAVEHLLNGAVYEEMIVNLRKECSREDSVDFNQIMEEQERRLIAFALKKEGTTRKAAEYLNLPQATLARKKVRYGL